jgi:hypothetical protein
VTDILFCYKEKVRDRFAVAEFIWRGCAAKAILRKDIKSKLKRRCPSFLTNSGD